MIIETKHNNRLGNYKRLDKFTRKKIAVNRSYQSGGGLFSYIFDRHGSSMRKFNNALKELDESKNKFRDEYDSYIGESKNYKQMAMDISKVLSDWVVSTKSKLTLEYLEENHDRQDKKRTIWNFLFGKKIVDVKYENIKYNLKLATTRVSTLENELKSLIKQSKKDMKQFKTLNLKFKKNLDRYSKALNMINQISKFKQDVKNLYSKYSVLSKLDKEKLTKSDISYIDKFEKNREDYLKVLSLTDSYIQNANEKISKFSRLRANTEYNQKQIERIISIQSKTAKEITEWKDEMKKFLNAIDSALLSDSLHIDKLKKIKEMIISISLRYKAVSSGKDDMKKLRAINNFLDEIIKYKEMLSDRLKRIKAEFLNYQPAIRIQYETFLITGLIYKIKEMLLIIQKLLDNL